jgi:hypothetical protein
MNSHPTSQPRGPGLNDRRHFTSAEAAAMLKTAQPNERGFLALALFAGIRPHMLEYLPPECVDVKWRRIWIPRSTALDSRDHVICTDDLMARLGEPAPLAAMREWLVEFPFQPQPWTPLQRRLQRAVGFWIPNGCRFTAITMSCAFFGTDATFRVMGVSPVPYRRTLIRVASFQDALDFYGLTPKAVL